LINLLVNFAVFNLLWLTFLRNSEVKAKIVATLVATTCAYFMNRHWTYRDRPKSTLRREYSLFFLFNAVGLVIEAGVVGLAKYEFMQTNIVVLNLCSGLGIVLGTVFRFWAYRTHVFKIDTAAMDAVDAEASVLSAAAAIAAVPDPALVGSAGTDPAAAHLARVEPALADPTQQGLVTGSAVVVPRAPVDDARLRAELTQLELDEILAQERTPG